MDRNTGGGGGTNRKMTARETVIQALDLLETENDQLKNLNSKIKTELNVLEHENERLRNELNQMKNERNGMRSRIEKVDVINTDLHNEIQLLTSKLSDGTRSLDETKTKWHEERSVHIKQIEDLRNLITQREEAKKRTEREVDALRNRLERAARKNYNDRDIELLHEVEMLKEEKNDLAGEMEDLNKANKKLKAELSNMGLLLEEKDSELKNESRRHSLLTKEFNSLLDENNRLKLQMRRKSNQHLNRFVSSSSERLNETVTIGDLRSNGSPDSQTSRSNISRQPPVSREPSLIINNEVFQPTRDYPFSSREKFSVSRMTNMTSREPSLVKRGSSFSVRDGKKGGRPSAARVDDRTSPDTLPTLGSATGKSHKSKS